MINRIKTSISTARAKLDLNENGDGCSSKPEKYVYARPFFLGLNRDEVLGSNDFAMRPIITPRIDLPFNTGYAECLNAGKSEQNEDNCSVCVMNLCNRSLEARNHVNSPGVRQYTSPVWPDVGEKVKEDQQMVNMASENMREAVQVSYHGLFDGHAGYSTSLIASRLLHKHLQDKLEASLDLMQQINTVGYLQDGYAMHQISVDDLVRGALEDAFAEMDDQLDRERDKYLIKGGCTALVALMMEGKLYVANAGDSRAVLCQGDSVTQVSRDFTPETERKRLNFLGHNFPHLLHDEFCCTEFNKRISRCDIGKPMLCRKPGMDGWSFKTTTEDDLKFPLIIGQGKKARVMGTIGVTRGLGDHDLYVFDSDIWIKPFLSSKPEVQIIDLTKGDWTEQDVLIMATDGLWDVVTNHQAVDIVRNALSLSDKCDPKKYSIAAQEVVSEARGIFTSLGWKKVDKVTAGSFDDITALVIPIKEYVNRWKNHRPLDEVSHSSYKRL